MPAFSGILLIIDVFGFRKWAFPLCHRHERAAVYMDVRSSSGKIVGVFTEPLAERMGSFGTLFGHWLFWSWNG